MMRNRHLPARCTPAANQSLEGAAGEATPREARAARGHLQFPQPLTVAVAARNEPGACQPLSCLLPFPDGRPGLTLGQGLSGATHQRQLELDFLPSPCDLSWASLVPTQPQMSSPHPPYSVFPACKEGDPGWPGPLSPDSKGPWEVPGTWLCRKKDILPVRAAHTAAAAAPRLPSSKWGPERLGSQWEGSVTTRSLACQGVTQFEILRVSDP